MNMAGRGQPVLLWGMMGAGKSAVAREIQSSTSLNVVDLDHQIQMEHGQSPSQIIQSLGLSRFREMEATALRRLLHEAAHSHRALAMRLLRASHVGSHEQSQAWTDPQVTAAFFIDEQ